MAGTISLGSYTYPFDEEIFAAQWGNQPDLVTNALVQSGVLVEDGYIGQLIAAQGNVYTVPFYGLLADDNDDNYDGKTDVTFDTMGASNQTGVVYGRMHGWYADDFVADFTLANPMAAIAARVAKYWQNKRQKRVIGILDAVTELSGMSTHKVTKSELDPCTISDTITEIFGEHRSQINLCIMHSAVAQVFEDMQRVDYLKYTDPNGVTRDLNIYTVNGITTIIDDGVPMTAASGDKAATYTTYLLGAGALRHASAPVAHPASTVRDEVTRGGVDKIITRFRETIHPNGFNFKMGTGSAWSASPTDAQLSAKANWELAYPDVKAIPVAKLITPAVKA